MFILITRLKYIALICVFLTIPFAQASKQNEGNDEGFVKVESTLPGYFLNYPVDVNDLVIDPELHNFLLNLPIPQLTPIKTPEDMKRIGDIASQLNHRYLERRLDDLFALGKEHDRTAPQTKIAQLIRALNPKSNNADIETTIALAACYLNEFTFVQHRCLEILMRIKELQANNKENKDILEHMRLNPQYFPTASSTLASALDAITKDTSKQKEEDLNTLQAEPFNALCEGVGFMQTHLNDQVSKNSEQILLLTNIHSQLALHISLLKSRLNSDEFRRIFYVAKRNAITSIAELKEQLTHWKATMKDRLKDLLQVHGEEASKKAAITELTKLLEDKNKTTDFEKLLTTALALENSKLDDSHQKAAERLNNQIQAAQSHILTTMNKIAVSGNQITWLLGLPTDIDLSQKAAAQDIAINELVKDHSKQQLLQALRTLKSGLTDELIQITNDQIEYKLTGFTAEGFVRWILVNKTHQLVPLISEASIKFCEARLGRMDSQLIEANHQDIKLLPSKDRTAVTTHHFPKASELQNSKGKVAEALICVIQNLPKECFIEIIEQHVKKSLEDNNRKEWVQSIGGYFARYASTKIFDRLQVKITDMIHNNAGDPSLLPLGDDQLLVLLEQRSASGHDQSNVTSTVQELRQEATTGLPEYLANLGLLQHERPSIITSTVSSSLSSLSSWGGWLIGTQPSTNYQSPTVTWEQQQADELNQARTLLAYHIQKLNDARLMMRGKQTLGVAQVTVLQ